MSVIVSIHPPLADPAAASTFLAAKHLGIQIPLQVSVSNLGGIYPKMELLDHIEMPF